MKNYQNILLWLAIMVIPFFSFAQHKSCCSPQAFASLGSDKNFVSAHAAPEPINFAPSKGSEVTFDTPDGHKGKAFLIPSAEKSNKYLLVIHEWWGLNDYIRQESEKYAAEFPKVNIMALDLFDGKTTTSADEAAKIMQAVDPARAESIIRGAMRFGGKDAAFQSVGWCFGGGWSLQAAIMAGNQSKGCVMYYGMPENDQQKLQQLSAPVLGLFAAQDGWINRQVVDGFVNSMKEAGKPLEVKWFDADHAFANPSNPKFNSAAATEARKYTLAFLHTNFGE